MSVDSQLSYNFAQVTWQPSGAETSWRVFYRETSSNVWDSIFITNTPVADIINLQAKTKYTVKVKALCTEGVDESKFSDEISFETLCGFE